MTSRVIRNNGDLVTSEREQPIQHRLPQNLLIISFREEPEKPSQFHQCNLHIASDVGFNGIFYMFQPF